VVHVRNARKTGKEKNSKKPKKDQTQQLDFAGKDEETERKQRVRRMGVKRGGRGTGLSRC